MTEAGCLVCGNPLDISAWFGVQNCGERDSKQTGAENEVCSDECLETYTKEQ
jgi:predicted nucleic acid-binding Zn ribbon protein